MIEVPPAKVGLSADCVEGLIPVFGVPQYLRPSESYTARGGSPVPVRDAAQ